MRHYSVDAKVNALSYVALTLCSLGYPDQALKRAYEAVEFAQALAHLHSLASAQGILSQIQLSRGEPRAAQATLERLLAFCAEHGFTHWSAFATFHRGLSLTEQGRHEEGIPLMEEGIAGHRATGARIGHPFFLCALSEAYMQAGRLGDGLSTLSEALALADEQEERQHECEIHRVKGELLLRQDDSNVGEAQRCFERAIEVARKHSAKSSELRATTSLARLLVQQGHRDETRAILTGIYNWFTEGFDTVDLKDAKALLEELTG